MGVDYSFTALKIEGFRGIRKLDLDLPEGVPTYIVGTNNCGKSTVLNALALALHGGGFHKFVPTQHDFYCDVSGHAVADFKIDICLAAKAGSELPAVQGVGSPIPVHGLRALGRTSKAGKHQHRHVLLDKDSKAIATSPRTALKGSDKERFMDQDLGWRNYYARIDEIRKHVPEIWLVSPENLNRSLYVWQTGPLQRLARLLTERFLDTEWTFDYGGEAKRMPATLEAAHSFFRACVADFPFWKDELKPQLEGALGSYIGRSASIGLQPDVLVLEEWLQQQLACSFSAEAGGPLVPLPNMGDGWQALVRLAALEVVASFEQESPSTPVVLLCEEPEAYLHPHLRRKLRAVLARLAENGWLVISATHASEFIDFNESQQIVRLWRNESGTTRGHIDTSDLPDAPKFQSRLDERGNHELVLANRVIFCEGKDDTYALKDYLVRMGLDLDGKGVTLLDVGGCGSHPDYARMAASLGVPWCSVTDEDLLPDGTVKQPTDRVRNELAKLKTSVDQLVVWPRTLEESLGLSQGKATPDWQDQHLRSTTIPEVDTAHSDFGSACRQVAGWISSVAD